MARVKARCGLRLLPALLAASLPGACANNLLALIDGPYVPPSQRTGQEQPTAPAVAPDDLADRPAPAAMPPEALAPSPALPQADNRPQALPEELAWPDTRFVGPVLTAPEMAELAAAADRAAPDQEPASPAPDAPPPAATEAVLESPADPGTDTSVYAAFHRFVLTWLESPAGSAGRQSMLLVDPPSLDPALQRCGARPPAVLIDLDPAASLLPLGGEMRADSQLAAFLGDLRQRGVTIYWITGHAPDRAGVIRAALRQTRLDPAGNDPLIVSRFATERKQSRRRALAETDCLVAILGDSRSDFDELYDYLIDLAAAQALEPHIGNGWFLGPNPLQ